MKIVLLILLVATQICFAQHPPEVIFRIPEKDLIPEGVTYDPAGKDFYLGSIQKRKILKISANGRITDFAGAAAGLFTVLGMNVWNEKLWVCNNSPEYDSTQRISAVHIFDLKTGKLWKKYLLEDGSKHLFNDVVISSDGTGYISDSDGGAIYRIRTNTDTVETFLKPGSIRYPNGISLSTDEKKLIVSTGSGLGIVTIDLTSKAITPLSHEKFLLIGVDGLYRHKNSLIAVQNVTFPEAILEFKCTADFTAVESVRSIVSGIPEFDSPTTGVIVEPYFYFIANSQLLQTIGSKGSIKNPAALKESLIMRIRLE